MQNAITHIIGVDGGGSSCRIAIAMADGRVIGRAEGPAANPTTDLNQAVESIQATLNLALQNAGLDDTILNHACAYLGLAGVMNAQIADAVASRFPAASVTVTDDRPTTMAGALQARAGFVAALGTGSFLGCQTAKGRRFAGGWGLVLGDQASGAWLGRQLLSHVLEWCEGLRPGSELLNSVFQDFHSDPSAIVSYAATAQPKDFATFAPRILDAADADDSTALGLMRDGADYIQHTLDCLAFQPGACLCLMGGLGPRYAAFIDPKYTRDLTAPLGSALDGAVRLAMDMVSSNA